MIRDDRKPVPDVLRQDIREWLLYLQDIGVRDLRLEGLASEGRVPVTEPSPEAVFAHPAPSPRPSAAAPGPGLYVLDGDAPADPEGVLREIREDLGDCTRCKLCLGRTHLVFGVGDPRARLKFVGEGPGADEDAKGEPFVGRAGKKLNEMIRAIGLERDQVYIANVVKCRPPGTRSVF